MTYAGMVHLPPYNGQLVGVFIRLTSYVGSGLDVVRRDHGEHL